MRKKDRVCKFQIPERSLIQIIYWKKHALPAFPAPCGATLGRRWPHVSTRQPDRGAVYRRASKGIDRGMLMSGSWVVHSNLIVFRKDHCFHSLWNLGIILHSNYYYFLNIGHLQPDTEPSSSAGPWSCNTVYRWTNGWPINMNHPLQDSFYPASVAPEFQSCSSLWFLHVQGLIDVVFST